jgi:hypothetical protein
MTETLDCVGDLADRLDGLPVGDELIRLVLDTDPAKLGRYDSAARLRAINRIVAAFEGQLQRQLVELAHTLPDQFDDLGVEPALRQQRVDEFIHAEIGSALTWTSESAGRRLHFAKELLDRLPAVHEAMTKGDLDYPKVHRMVCGVRDMPDLKLARQVIGTVLPVAPRMNTTQLGRAIRTLVLKLDPDAAARRAERAAKRRRVSNGLDADGTAYISGTGLEPAPAAAAMERIDSCARAARAAGDERTLEQLRADCFVGLLNGTWDAPQPAHRSGVIELTVPLTTLIGFQDLPGDLSGWGPVCAEIARKAAEHAAAGTRFTYTVHDDDEVVSHGSLKRPPAAMAEFVRVRTDVCVAPGCTRPARRCDIDHRIRRIDHGQTEPDNLHPLCRRHHRCKDEGGWQYTVVAPGIYVWSSPSGHTYVADKRRFVDLPADNW